MTSEKWQAVCWTIFFVNNCRDFFSRPWISRWGLPCFPFELKEWSPVIWWQFSLRTCLVLYVIASPNTRINGIDIAHGIPRIFPVHSAIRFIPKNACADWAHKSRWFPWAIRRRFFRRRWPSVACLCNLSASLTNNDPIIRTVASNNFFARFFRLCMLAGFKCQPAASLVTPSKPVRLPVQPNLSYHIAFDISVSSITSCQQTSHDALIIHCHHRQNMCYR